MRPSNKQSGFTILEITIAIALFGLILVLGYGAIISTATGTKQFHRLSANDQQIRNAHQSLRNAIESGASLRGNKQSLELDLKDANNQWLENSERITFKITTDGQLIATMHPSQQVSILMSGLDNARFSFIDIEGNLNFWNKNINPAAVVFSWQQQDNKDQWRFLSK